MCWYHDVSYIAATTAVVPGINTVLLTISDVLFYLLSYIVLLTISDVTHLHRLHQCTAVQQSASSQNQFWRISLSGIMHHVYSSGTANAAKCSCFFLDLMFLRLVVVTTSTAVCRTYP